jgi:hypothetical protein
LWTDCDEYEDACEDYCGYGEGTFIKSGENQSHGEYQDNTTEECCGDDADEFAQYRQDAGGDSCHNENDNNCTFGGSDLTDVGCCENLIEDGVEYKDCIYNGRCYKGGDWDYENIQLTSEFFDGASCWRGKWYDFDYYEGACVDWGGPGYNCFGNSCWLPGEADAGEYNNDGAVECCGDDAKELPAYRKVNETCNDILDDYCAFSGDDLSDMACCAPATGTWLEWGEFSRCVYNGKCYKDYWETFYEGDPTESRAIIDGLNVGAYCGWDVDTEGNIKGFWYDCDGESPFTDAKETCEDMCGLSTACNGRSCWLQGGEETSFGEYNSGDATECCTDDAGEFAEYRNGPEQFCDDVKDDYCAFGGWNIDDMRCCDDNVDCVYEGRCYDIWDVATVEDRAAAICIGNWWYDCDIYCDSCGYTNAFVKSGESQPHGEYQDNTTEECCGDDANEYLIDGICCNNENDQNVGGVCRATCELTAESDNLEEDKVKCVDDAMQITLTFKSEDAGLGDSVEFSCKYNEDIICAESAPVNEAGEATATITCKVPYGKQGADIITCDAQLVGGCKASKTLKSNFNCPLKTTLPAKVEITTKTHHLFDVDVNITDWKACNYEKKVSCPEKLKINLTIDGKSEDCGEVYFVESDTLERVGDTIDKDVERGEQETVNVLAAKLNVTLGEKGNWCRVNISSNTTQSGFKISLSTAKTAFFLIQSGAGLCPACPNLIDLPMEMELTVFKNVTEADKSLEAMKNKAMERKSLLECYCEVGSGKYHHTMLILTNESINAARQLENYGGDKNRIRKYYMHAMVLANEGITYFCDTLENLTLEQRLACRTEKAEDCWAKK